MNFVIAFGFASVCFVLMATSPTSSHDVVFIASVIGGLCLGGSIGAAIIALRQSRNEDKP